MVHVHGPRVQQQSEPIRRASLDRLAAVAIDAGKSESLALVADFGGQRLAGPFRFAMNRGGIGGLADRVGQAVGDEMVLVRLGVEASGFHLPLLAPGLLPASWEIVEFNPAHVAAQRKVNGQRGVKTDEVDATAIFDLIVAGRGSPVATTDEAIVELAGWVTFRQRRVDWKRSVGQHLWTQLHRAFPGASDCVHQVLGTQVGRLIVTEFSDPARLARLGPERFRAFARRRGLRVTRQKAADLVTAARESLPTADAEIAREAIAADWRLIEELERHIDYAEARLTDLLPSTPYQVLTTTPGWGVVRAAAYGAAVGQPDRWQHPKRIYRASGLTPRLYESSGRRIDGGISREGATKLRQALLDLARGLRRHELGSAAYARQLAARGKHNGVVLCALANRANRIAFAMVRHQQPFDPDRWR